jgi:hypothetical protein
MTTRMYRDGWQVSVQAGRDQDGPRIELFVFHAQQSVERKVVLSGSDAGLAGGVPERFARHCAIKLHRKLVESGIEIPQARTRIAEVLAEQWNG